MICSMISDLAKICSTYCMYARKRPKNINNNVPMLVLSLHMYDINLNHIQFTASVICKNYTEHNGNTTNTRLKLS